MNSKYRLAVLLTFVALSVSELAAEPLRILTLGDSITQGRGPRSNSGNAWTPTFSYRYPLWKMLIDAGVSFEMVGSLKGGFEGDPDWADYKGHAFGRAHEGHWGWKATDVAAKLPEWSSGYTADIATIILGSNDATGETSEQKLASVPRVSQAMGDIIQILRQKNPKVIILLGQCYQEWEPFPAMRQAMIALAKEKSSLASPIIIVDHSTGWVSNPKTEGTHTVDWVHPNRSGDEKIARNFFAAMKPFLPAKK
jgi:lysophospholipase L1-like esterase